MSDFSSSCRIFEQWPYYPPTIVLLRSFRSAPCTFLLVGDEINHGMGHHTAPLLQQLILFTLSKYCCSLDVPDTWLIMSECDPTTTASRYVIAGPSEKRACKWLYLRWYLHHTISIKLEKALVVEISSSRRRGNACLTRGSLISNDE
jgi:hypothetical protein